MWGALCQLIKNKKKLIKTFVVFVRYCLSQVPKQPTAFTFRNYFPFFQHLLSLFLLLSLSRVQFCQSLRCPVYSLLHTPHTHCFSSFPLPVLSLSLLFTPPSHKSVPINLPGLSLLSCVLIHFFAPPPRSYLLLFIHSFIVNDKLTPTLSSRG